MSQIAPFALIILMSLGGIPVDYSHGAERRQSPVARPCGLLSAFHLSRTVTNSFVIHDPPVDAACQDAGDGDDAADTSDASKKKVAANKTTKGKGKAEKKGKAEAKRKARDKGKAEAKGETTEGDEPSAEELEQLRSLGYVD